MDSKEFADKLHLLPYALRRHLLWHRVRPRLQRFLYKYRALDPRVPKTVEQARDLIVGSRIWLSSPDAFNDPFDTMAEIVVEGTPADVRARLNTAFKRMGVASSKLRRKRIDELMCQPREKFVQNVRGARDSLRRQLGICSFAGTPRSILAWSHYAASHTGICLQFEVARDFRVFNSVLPVQYALDYPRVDWVCGFDESILKSVLQKHSDWRYEHEHRMIRHDAANSSRAFDAAALRAVIIGCRADPHTVSVLQELLQERSKRGRPPVILYRAVQHETQYKVRILRYPLP